MTVLNKKKTVEAIQTFIVEQAKEAKAKRAVAGLSGGADSALVALLCKDVIPYIGVLMPCHSSNSAKERALELAKAHSLETIEVKLDDAFQTIFNQVATHLSVPVNNAQTGALRSCLRAPTLDFVAKCYDGIIVGTGNRDEDEMTRYFQKRGDGCVDISPIAKLHKSEVYELLKFLGCTQSIIDAVPTADLWGPDSGQQDEKELGLTYSEVEWGIRALSDHRFGFHPTDPDCIGNFSDRQQHILKTLEHMEKVTRHKAEPPPVFDPRCIPGLLD